MSNPYNLQPWHDCIGRLVDVAAGRAPADLVIRDGRWVNVYSGEIIPHIDVAIAAGRFALVGNAGHPIGPDTPIIDAAGPYLLPALSHAHIHLETGLYPPTQSPP